MKSTKEMIDNLKEQGYDISEPYLNSLLRTEAIPPPEKFGHIYAWSPSDIDRLKSVLRRRQRFSPSQVDAMREDNP